MLAQDKICSTFTKIDRKIYTVVILLRLSGFVICAG